MESQNQSNRIKKEIFDISKEIIEIDFFHKIEIFMTFLNQTIALTYFPIAKSFEINRNIHENKILEIATENYLFYVLFLSMYYKNNQNKKIYKNFVDNEPFQNNIKNFWYYSHKFDESIQLEEINDSLNISQNLWSTIIYDKKFFLIASNPAFQYLLSREIQKNQFNQEIIHKYNWSDRDQFGKHIGKYFFSNSIVFEEVIIAYSKYFSFRISSKSEEIDSMSHGFIESLKICEGNIYLKIQYTDFKKQLYEKLSFDEINEFLDKFFYLKHYNLFPSQYEELNRNEILREFNLFLKKAGFVYSGQIYTGVFIIFRSFLQYIKEIQTEPEFRNWKGDAIENWCYELCGLANFPTRKLILRNNNRNPSPKYRLMKQNISSFSGKVLENQLNFLDSDSSSFHEIDLLIRVSDKIIILECKGTAMSNEFEQNQDKWMDYYKSQWKLLQLKQKELVKAMDDEVFQDPFFSGITETRILLLRGEGLYGMFGTIPIPFFPQLIRKYEISLQNHNFDNIWKQDQGEIF